MSRKLNYKSISPFHDRLFWLIGGNVDWWAEQIGVSASLIRDKWFKGSFPGVDKIIKICEITGIGADRILLGKEISYKSCKIGCTEEQKELGRQVIKVLNSKTTADYSGSLTANIKSFYQAVIAEENHKKDIEDLRNEMQSQINDLNSTINQLKGYIRAHNSEPPQDHASKKEEM